MFIIATQNFFILETETIKIFQLRVCGVIYATVEKLSIVKISKHVN